MTRYGGHGTEGTEIIVGMLILGVETDKIANAVEAPDAGLLRRRVASAGDTLPVKVLLGVRAPSSVSDAEIDEYVSSYVTPAEDSEEGEEAATYHFVDVDGIRVRYASRGGDASRPCGAVHPRLRRRSGQRLFNLDALAEKNRVFALDKAYLVGHSIGGGIAAQIAADQPARVESVALISPSGFGYEVNNAYTEGFVKAESRRELKPVVELLFANPELVSRQMRDDLRLDGVTDALASLNKDLFAGGKQSAKPGGRLAESGKLVLIVWGGKDQIIPASHAENAPSGATVKVFDDAGHMSQMEKANEVNALLKEHVSR